MAQLHRRIRRIQNSFVDLGVALATGLALFAAGTWVQGAAPAAADPPKDGTLPSIAEGLTTSEGELREWAEQLGSDSPGSRAEAIEALGSLDEEALPAIRARVEAMGEARGMTTDAAYDALRSFRHVLGSRRADDMLDIVPGVPRVLDEVLTPASTQDDNEDGEEDAEEVTAEEREATVVMAERLLLARALERMGTTEAARVLVDLMATDFEAWRWEAKRILHRMGAHLLPALIETRGHEDRHARKWARWAIEELGMEAPGDAVQIEDGAVLGDLLRAYARVSDMDAMPIVVSFTTHERAQVRDAARWAAEQYGQNAVWQFRRVYENVTKEDANTAWGWRRTMDELYAAADEQRLAPVKADLEAGLAAQDAGDLEAMQRHFDAVLLKAPSLEGREQMAKGHALLAARALEADDLVEAGRLFRRALRLDPESEDRKHWYAQIAYIDAEQSLAQGVVDLERYEEALALAPDHEGAQRAVEALTGKASERTVKRRRWALAGAALLLLIAAWLVWRRPRRDDGGDEPDADGEPNEDGRGALDTLPG